MNRSPFSPLIKALVAVASAILIGWLLYEFVFKGTVAVDFKGRGGITTITAVESGATIANSSDTNFRLSPGTYNVSVTSDDAGVTKRVTVRPLSSTTITLPETAKLNALLVAQAGLFGIIPAAGGDVIGFDPIDNSLKRVNQLGVKTTSLSNPQASEESDAEIATEADSYKAYKKDELLVGSGGILFHVTQNAVAEVSRAGITLAEDTSYAPLFVISENETDDAFVVAYKQDVYLYDNPGATPKKIYTAAKKFDHLNYKNGKLVVYAADLPITKENPRDTFSDYQVDPLIIDIASKQERAMSGPVQSIRFNPGGNLAVVIPTTGQGYIYNIQNNQSLQNVERPLIAGPVWTNDTSYVFSRDKKLWQYDVQSQESLLLAEVPDTITSISAPTGGDYLLTTYPNATEASIYRVGKNVPAWQKNDLTGILPYRETDFSITYVAEGNRIIIETYAPLNSPSHLDRFRAETQQMRASALDYLQRNNVDIKNYMLTFNPGDPL